VPVDIVVASWNVHSGVDGWGRPFDVVAGCRSIDADVLVLEETWTPDSGRALARQVADALGYRVEEVAIARALMFEPPGHFERSWGPPLWGRSPHGTRVDTGPLRRGHGRPIMQRGTIGLAVLSRLAVGHVETWDLGRRFGDPTRRSAIAVEVMAAEPGVLGQRRALVVGTHLSHLRHGSLAQIAHLRRMLARRAGSVVPAVLAGDMNLPGPPLSILLPGWRRVVRARTWPAWRPIAQSDHILLTAAVAGSGEVLPIQGSDHLPVRARLTLT